MRELSKQQQKSLETRSRIFSAAKQILKKHGYEALSIKNICEEAGEKTVAGVIALAGSVAAIYVLLPLMESVLTLMEQML